MLNDFKTPAEVEKFMEDFFSPEELEKYVKKLATIYWLKKGRDADNIKINLNSSKKEILDAQTALKKEGVKLGLKYIEAEEWANQWVEKIKKFTKK